MKRLASLIAAVAAVTLVSAVAAQSAGPTNLSHTAYIAINYDGSVDVDRTNGVTLTSTTNPELGGAWKCAQMSFVPISYSTGAPTGGVILPGDNSPDGATTLDAEFFSGPDALCPDGEAAVYGGTASSKQYARFLG